MVEAFGEAAFFEEGGFEFLKEPFEEVGGLVEEAEEGVGCDFCGGGFDVVGIEEGDLVGEGGLF